MKLNVLSSKSWRRNISAQVSLLVFALAFPALLSAQPRTVVKTQDTGPHYVAGEVLIQFRADASDAELADATRQAGLQIKREVHTPTMRAHGHGAFHVASTGLSTDQAVALLKTHPAVVVAQPNWIYHHQAASDDYYYLNGSLWGVYGDLTQPANAYGSQAAEAWAQGYTGSGDVYVGVIDEGLQFDHPDLAANIWTNPGEIPGNGIDDDGDGYVDDVHGWNALDNNGNIYDPSSDDHGTHVSGTIGAIGGNGAGVAGINWNVKIISGKFLGPNGGTTADAIEAIDYMTQLKVSKGLNIVALNNSWGGGGFDQLLLNAIVRAAQHQILFVAAAGNGDFLGRAINTDNSPNYPSCYNTTAGAGYDAVISVAAIASDGTKASWSNYGAKTVDLGAPGVGIWSTLPNNSYGSYSGTSMATPHVTGAVALYASSHPGQTAQQIKSALLGAAKPTASLSGITVTGGRLDLSSVIAPPVPPSAPPSAPGTLSATAVSSSQINLAWGDSDTEDGFKVERSLDGSSWTEIATLGANTTTFSDTGLSASTTYYYRVYAYNVAGASPYSNVASASTQAPLATPLAPGNLRITSVAKTWISFAWNDNSSNETGFAVERSSDGVNWSQIGTVPANSTGATNSGLNPNHVYYYRVRAYNNAGYSGYSNIASARTLKN